MLPFDADMTGTYKAIFCYAGQEVCREFEGVTGEPLLVPLNGLNENYRHRFYLLNPDGARVVYDAGATDYNCFALKLVLPTDDSAPSLDLSGITCEQLLDDVNGLTTQQLLDCLLPWYNFADTAVLDALTDQQETDLEAAFGGGGPSVPDDHYYATAIGTP